MPSHHRLATIWHRFLEVEVSLDARARSESAHSTHLDEGDDDVGGNDHIDRNGRPGFPSTRKKAGAPPYATTAAARRSLALCKESRGGQVAWPKFDCSNAPVFKEASAADIGKHESGRAKTKSVASAAAAADSWSQPLFRAVTVPLINSTGLFDLFTAWVAYGDGCAYP
jgi:hypothetical protein